METFKYLTELLKSQLNKGVSPPATRDALPSPREAEAPPEDYPVERHHISVFHSFDSVMGHVDMAMKELDEVMGSFGNFGIIEDGFEPKSTNPRDQLLKQPDSEYKEPDTSRNIETWISPVQMPFSPFNHHASFVFGTPEHFHSDSPRSSYIKDQSDDLFPNAATHYENYQERNLEEEVIKHTRYFKNISIQKVYRPDGKIEVREAFTDSSGNEKVTETVIDSDVEPKLPFKGFFW